MTLINQKISLNSMSTNKQVTHIRGDIAPYPRMNSRFGSLSKSILFLLLMDKFLLSIIIPLHL